jgi:hypothetical protein
VKAIEHSEYAISSIAGMQYDREKKDQRTGAFCILAVVCILDTFELFVVACILVNGNGDDDKSLPG